METKDKNNIQLRAHEAFIRRASKINMPFMLKGSYITRQYFKNPANRIPADLDWVYIGEKTEGLAAREIFNSWLNLVTELDLDDGVKFISIKDNFWETVDYGMADDFPTVNNEIECMVDDEKAPFSLDISFNLDIEQAPIPLMYQPLVGEAFLVPNTVPISLQVSWKIHQTLVRPRFKDLFDLIHLVQHPSFNKENLDKMLQALVNECSADNLDLTKLKHFLSYDIPKLFQNESIKENWHYWRFDIIDKKYYNKVSFYEEGKQITDVNLLPEKLDEFLKVFGESLKNSGIGIYLLDQLPKPTRIKRKGLESNTHLTNFPIAQPKSTILRNRGFGIKWSIVAFFKRFFK